MNVIKVRLNSEKLKQLPGEDRNLFIGLGHIFNEINAITKMLYWTCNAPQQNKAEENGQYAMILLIIKILAGKLYESWKFFKTLYFRTRISIEYDPKLNGEPKETFDKLKKYFRKGNHINTIRNNFGFHYSLGKTGEMLNRIDTDFDIYLERNVLPNNLFYFVEVLDAIALLDGIGFDIDNHDSEKELINLSDELLEVGQWFLCTADGLMDLIIEKQGVDNKEDEIEPIRFEDLREFTEIHLPWFTKVQ